MAKTKRYQITLNHVSRSTHNPDILLTTFTIGGAPLPRRVIEADKLADVLAQADAFAAEHGEACNVAIRCLDPPKPAGFDAATRRLFRNIERAERPVGQGTITD